MFLPLKGLLVWLMCVCVYIYIHTYIYIQDIMYIGKDSLQPHWEGPYQATSPKQTSVPISDTQL